MRLHKASLDDVLMFSVQLDGPESVVAEGFTLNEFQSGDGLDQVLIHPVLLEGLVALRDWAGTWVKLNSAFRSVWWNQQIGGATKSKHKLGMAADVVVGGKHPDDVAAWAEAVEFGGVGRYNTFTHVDVAGYGRRWDERR